MASIRRATGRVCQRVGDGWQKLEVVVASACKDFEESTPPYGLMDIERVAKNTFSLKYDARKTGARELLEALRVNKGYPIRLAPPESHYQIPQDIRRAGCLTAISSILTLPILILAWAPLPENKLTYGIVSLILATLVQIIVAGPFYPKALKSLFVHRSIDMDLLIVLSTTITYTFSVASFTCEALGSPLTSGMYFETSTLLISLIMLGRFIADLACHQVVVSQSVRSLQPHTALLVDDLALDQEVALDQEGFEEVDVRLLQLGDRIKVAPGCIASTDGVVLYGISEFDESVVTGEANVVKKSKGSAVIAGSTNRSTAVIIEVTRLPGENTISEIADLVEEVSHSKPKSQVIADQVACWIVPLIGTLATLTLVVWILVGKLVRGEPTGSAILHAMTYAVSVLVVSCPCAIGLVIPVLQVVASGVGAKHGVMIRSADVLNVARKVDHVVFDKTGTLTDESLSVLSEQYCSYSSGFASSLALALASYSNHPVSSAVASHLRGRIPKAIHVSGLGEVIGQGIEGTLNGKTVRMGNARWVGQEGSFHVQPLLSRKLTVLCVVCGDQLVAVFGLEATIRPGSAELITRLKKRGIRVSIMSGDEVGAVHKVAKKLGIPPENTWARCSPREKQQHVKELMQSKGNTVLFCGDGVNDAAALSQASVGLHISNGAEFTQSAADAILVKASLNSIIVLMDLSRDCYHRIVFGFSWSAFYNIFAILFAAGAFINIRLPPEYAGLGEAVSVLPVILVPLLLRWKNYT